MSQRSFLFRIACGILPVIGAWGQQYTINTVAGNQLLGPGYGADNDSATADQLNGPVAVALDSQGNLYIADSLNNRVRKVSGGTITTIAGNGTAGYSGDGGPATSAELNAPSGIAVDSSGNVFIADTKNNLIRKVGTDGKISTYSGNFNLGPGYGGDNASPTSAGAQFNNPVGLALDPSGNLYIADSRNSLVRRIDSGATSLTTVIGQAGTAGVLSNPVALSADAKGQYLYVTDTTNKSILRFQFATRGVTTVAGNGASGYSPDGPVGISTMVNGPAGVLADAAGNVYFSDTANSLVRVVTANGILNTVAGRVLSGRPIPGYSGDAGPATTGQLSSPRGLAFDKSGNLYVADSGNNIVRMLQPSYPAIASGGVGNAFSYKAQISPGAAATIFGTGFGSSTLSAKPTLPTGLGPVSVLVNGVAAAIYYVAPGQVNFQVPWETGLGTASVVVTVNGGASNTASVPVVSAGPGLHPIIQNYPEYSINGSSAPIAAGGTIVAYATGSGPVSAQQTNGAVPSGSSPVTVTSTCTATIGTGGATVSFCGLQGNSVGLVQVNVTIPSGLAPGTYPLTVTINGQASNPQNVVVK